MRTFFSLGWASHDHPLWDIEKAYEAQLSLLLTPNVRNSSANLIKSRIFKSVPVRDALDQVWEEILHLPLSEGFRLCSPYLAPEPKRYFSNLQIQTLTSCERLIPNLETPTGSWKQFEANLATKVLAFVQTFEKVARREASKDPSFHIADCRNDDVWGAYCKLPEDQRMDAVYLLLGLFLTLRYQSTMHTMASDLKGYLAERKNPAMQQLLESLFVTIDPWMSGFDPETTRAMDQRCFDQFPISLKIADVAELVHSELVQDALAAFMTGASHLASGRRPDMFKFILGELDHPTRFYPEPLRGCSRHDSHALKLITTFCRKIIGAAEGLTLENGTDKLVLRAMAIRKERARGNMAACILRVALVNWFGQPPLELQDPVLDPDKSLSGENIPDSNEPQLQNQETQGTGGTLGALPHALGLQPRAQLVTMEVTISGEASRSVFSSANRFPQHITGLDDSGSDPGSDSDSDSDSDNGWYQDRQGLMGAGLGRDSRVMHHSISHLFEDTDTDASTDSESDSEGSDDNNSDDDDDDADSDIDTPHGPFLFVRRDTGPRSGPFPANVSRNAGRATEWTDQDGIVSGFIGLQNANSMRNLMEWQRQTTLLPPTEERGAPILGPGTLLVYHRALTKSFGRVPPLRIPMVQSREGFALFAIRESLALQLPGLTIPSVYDMIREHFRITTALQPTHRGWCTLPERLSHSALTAIVKIVGRRQGIDLRLGILGHGQDPVLDLSEPVRRDTHFVWVYFDGTARIHRDGKVSPYRYMALKKVKYQGRSSHYILAVRQGVYASWPTGPTAGSE